MSDTWDVVSLHGVHVSCTFWNAVLITPESIGCLKRRKEECLMPGIEAVVDMSGCDSTTVRTTSLNVSYTPVSSLSMKIYQIRVISRMKASLVTKDCWSIRWRLQRTKYHCGGVWCICKYTLPRRSWIALTIPPRFQQVS